MNKSSASILVGSGENNTIGYFNRELSWLEFNQRVLEEARDNDNRLLERLKFLAITGSNLDEFFMVRVGGLQLLVNRGISRPDPSGLTPGQQLDAIARRTRKMLAQQYACFNDQLQPHLADAGIRCLGPSDYNQRQAQAASQLFEEEILPVLTPMAVTGQSDFPLLVNQTMNLCVRLKGAKRGEPARFAVIPFGRSVNRYLTLPSQGGYAYTLLEDLAAYHVSRFFAGEQVMECAPFRITRNADLSIQEDQAGDLMVEMEEVLDARRESPCVRLEIAAGAGSAMRKFLKTSLQVNDDDVFAAPGPLDLSAMMQLTSLSGFDHLRDEPWPPQSSPQIDLGASLFDQIAARDILLCHPFESFEPVVRLIEEAADDPDVLAIKQTLYRTSRNSPIVAALQRAAENGKNVTALIELRARFDEARNIEWAKNLEQSEVQVIYGVKGLKTHSKVCVIVRREPRGIQRYIHFGTGNYNESTARLYSDISLMTNNDELGADASSFFNAISGYSQPLRFRRLDAAPMGLRAKLLELIEAETTRKKEGQRARIDAKLNSLVDPEIIQALYEASQAGVKIRLNVRGICCLRPGVEGLSEHIEVISIVDRFLEHARILYFHHGGDGLMFISSADWMPRNLDRRVELLIPIEDVAVRDRLQKILETYFRDTAKSHRLHADGAYQTVRPKVGREPFRSQQELYRQACEAIKQAKISQRTTFEPYRKP